MSQEAGHVPELIGGSLSQLRRDNGVGRANARSLVFQVTSIDRYMMDDEFCKLVKIPVPNQSQDTNAFDLIMSDSQQLLKCVLHPNLNRLIYTDELSVCSIIQIDGFERVANEKELGAPAAILVTGVRVLVHTSALQLPSDDSPLAFAPEAVQRERKEVPLVGGRGCYLHRDADDCWGGMVQVNDITVTQLPAEIAQSTHRSIAELIRSPHHKAAFAFGRVVEKANVLFYGRPSDSNQRFPMSFRFTLADTSGSVSVVVWNAACMRYYSAVQLGDVVALSGFRLKRTATTNEPELAINPTNPTGVIVKLTAELYDADLVPDCVPWKVVPDAFPANEAFDVCGRVVTLGRLERHRSKVAGQFAQASGAGFSAYRWLRLITRPGAAPVAVQLFANSQLPALETLVLDEALMLTGLRLHRFNSQQFPALISTYNTQILRGAGLPRQSCPALVEFLRLYPDIARPAAATRSAVVGNSTVYPPIAPAVLVRELVPAWQITLMSEVAGIAAGLQYRERYIVLLQARISEITAPQESAQQSQPADQPRKAPARKAKTRRGRRGRPRKNAGGARQEGAEQRDEEATADPEDVLLQLTDVGAGDSHLVVRMRTVQDAMWRQEIPELLPGFRNELLRVLATLLLDADFAQQHTGDLKGVRSSTSFAAGAPRLGKLLAGGPVLLCAVSLARPQSALAPVEAVLLGVTGASAAAASSGGLAD